MNANATFVRPPVPVPPALPSWWPTLLAVLGTAVISVVGTVVYMRSGTSALGMSAGSILVDTVTYIPHIILLFGVLADMFTYEGVYSIPSLVGIVSIFGNYVFRFFWVGLNSLIGTAKRTAGVTPTPTPAPQQGGTNGPWFQNYDGCNVQGFESFGSRFAPQTLVVTATVFSYYIFDLVKNRGLLNAAAAIAVGSLLFMGEAALIGDCQPQGAEMGRDDEPTVIGKALRALAEGIFFGGSSFAIVQTYFPERLPSGVISPFPKRSKSELSPGPDGKLYDKDGYSWVVLPNGQTMPDLSTDRSRQAFNDLATAQLGKDPAAERACVSDTRLGTGVPAKQSCST